MVTRIVADLMIPGRGEPVDHATVVLERREIAYAAAGCDIFVSGQMYGANSMEIMHLINAGMTDLEAIEAATANGPETLGPMAPRSGQIVEGYNADVIALDTDPLDDRSVWGKPDRVTHVWQGGRRVK